MTNNSRNSFKIPQNLHLPIASGDIQMIRFSCGSCNHVLRAPAELAGKKGKCACCGAVNAIPSALSVEVSRAAEPSPFRSTADLEEKPIEAIAQSESARI